MYLLSHFSSFIEVLTGIYISMCMDDVLKGIWSPKYYEDLESALKEYYLKNHDELISRIVNANKEKADSIKKYMKNRASFFFISCIILLLFSGYESVFVSGADSSFQMIMFFLAVWMVFLSFFNKLLFSTKQHTVTAILLLILLTFLFYWINNRFFGACVSDKAVVNLVLVILIIPILWQAFVCWMFSGPYKGYISKKLANGKVNYELAEQGINEHNPDILPQRYRELYSKLSIQSSNAEQAKKACLENYLELMEGDIAKASDPKSVFRIFFSWCMFHLTATLNNIAISIHIKKRKTIKQQQS